MISYNQFFEDSFTHILQGCITRQLGTPRCSSSLVATYKSPEKALLPRSTTRAWGQISRKLYRIDVNPFNEWKTS